VAQTPPQPGKPQPVGPALFKVRCDGEEVAFEAIDGLGLRALPRRWPRKRIVIFRAVADVDPPASVRPRSRFVLVLRDPAEEITLVARGKTRVLVRSAQSLNEALQLVSKPPTPQDTTATAAVAAATSSRVWVSPGVQRRQAAERWLADVPALPADAPPRTDAEQVGGGSAGGPPVLPYMPDPKDQVIEQRWPGRLRLFVPGQTPRQLVRDPVGIVTIAILGMLVVMLLPAALRAPYFALPRPPLPFAIIFSVVMIGALLSRLTSNVIEVDSDELVLTWRTVLGIGGARRFRADEISHVAVRERRRVVIFRRAEKDRPISLGLFPTVEDAKSAARDLRGALGLETVGGPTETD
jgi:hypothetical protein